MTRVLGTGLKMSPALLSPNPPEETTKCISCPGPHIEIFSDQTPYQQGPCLLHVTSKLLHITVEKYVVFIYFFIFLFFIFLLCLVHG